MSRLRGTVSVILAFSLCVLFIDMLFVLFFGGINLDLPYLAVRSTTIEFPVISLLITSMLLLLVKGKWQETILLGAALVIAGVIGEIVLRVVGHPLGKPHVDYVAWYRPSSVFGHQLVPDFEGFGPLGVFIKINSDGFRDEAHVTGKSDRTIRILGLGDSFTFGWGVAADETFLRRLESRLAEKSGTRVEAINAGVPGWGLNQYYLFLKQRGHDYRPDVVLVAYFLDDLNGPIRERIAPNRAYESGLRYKGGILRHSRLYNFSKYLADAIRQNNRATRIPYLHDMSMRRAEWAKRNRLLIKRDENPVEERKRVDILDDFLARMQALVLELGSRLIMMYIPDVTQLRHPELQHINAVLERLCRERRIPFMDLTPIFERAEQPEEFYLWPRDPHTNARGHRVMAEALSAMLCDLDGLEALGCGDGRESAAVSAGTRKRPALLSTSRKLADRMPSRAFASSDVGAQVGGLSSPPHFAWDRTQSDAASARTVLGPDRHRESGGSLLSHYR